MHVGKKRLADSLPKNEVLSIRIPQNSFAVDLRESAVVNRLVAGNGKADINRHVVDVDKKFRLTPPNRLMRFGAKRAHRHVAWSPVSGVVDIYRIEGIPIVIMVKQKISSIG